MLINKPIEKPIEQSKVTLKVPVQESSCIHDKIIPIAYYAIPQTRSNGDSSSRMVKRKKTYGILEGKFQCIQVQCTDPLLSQLEYAYQKFLEIYQILTQKLTETLRKINLFKRV